MTPQERQAVEEAVESVLEHGYGRVEVIVKDGRVLHVRPTRDIMLAKTPITEER
jgi:hypothetical protein